MENAVIDDEVLPDEPPKRLEGKGYAKTSTLNLISRASSLNGLQNIFMPAGKCIIREQAVVRGDLARITIGKCCYLSQGVVLHPPSAVSQAGTGFLPITIGDFVHFGKDTVVRAASIGSCVRIGAGVVLGERTILKDCCEILPNSVVPPGTVIAPYTCWGGNPCKMLRTIVESFPKLVEWEAEERFSLLVPK